jgi:hypothetical protein
MHERRQFERIRIPESAKLFVRDGKGKKIGRLLILGRGGMMVSALRELPLGDKLNLTIVDEAEGASCDLAAVVRYRSDEGFGCEFERLDVEAAVEIGVWMGRFYGNQV